MSDFPGPFDPPELTVPYPPPEVGEGSPWAPADAENRDRILDWWRAWWRRVFFPWLARFIAYLNQWLTDAEDYIVAHAISGYSWRTTVTTINPTGTTNVVLVVPDESHRPVVVGDLVSDQSSVTRYGIVTAIIDDTHATVTALGTLAGIAGLGWFATVTTIAHSGTTAVVIVPNANHPIQVGDFVVDDSDSHAYGNVTIVTDSSHVTVAYIGTLQGPPGVADTGAFDFTTPSLAPAAVYQGQMAGQPNMVGAFVLTVDAECWVRVYASEAYMLADEGRTITTPLVIADDTGCYLDFVGIGSELSKTLTPGIMFTDIGLGLWLSVTNTSTDDTNTVAVHFDYRIFRE